MVRLSHKQQNYYRQVIFYSVILVLLIIFFLTIGIKLIVNLSILIATRNDKNVTEETQNNYLLPPRINDVPDATNSATIKISGTATHGNNLTLIVNNKPPKDIVIKDDDTFETDVILQKGQNELYLELKDKKQKITQQSEKYQVRYISEKPKLDVTSPHDGDKTNKNEITIEGTTDKGITLTINDAPAVVSVTGAFNYLVRLKDGENKFKVVATDDAGNQETKELTVTYNKDE